MEGPKVVLKEWSFMAIVLRVVPEGGDGVAVVVAHVERVGGGDGGGAGAGGEGGGVGYADRERKEIHLAAVESQLFGAVVVVLIGGGGLVAGETIGVGGTGPVGDVGVWIVGQQARRGDVVRRCWWACRRRR